MKIGVVFPQTEFGNDPAALRDYAQTAQALGFNHIVVYDHVLGANPDRPGGWTGPYTYKTPFHEVFALLAFMAAVTQRIELATGILILPQRETALVAKQAATLDVLSGGRLRLGVGLGWNAVEYEALHQDFHTRGRRIETQVELLRQLWTKPLVTYQGKWDRISDAGICPLPVQQPIPIWFGGSADPAVRRAARMGDGWLITFRSLQDARHSLDVLAEALAEHGRSKSAFGIEPRLAYGDGKPDGWLQWFKDWEAVGATHASFNTMGAGFRTPAEHITAIGALARAAGLST